MRNGYKSNPKNKSRLQMMQDRKFWSKNDILLLGDLSMDLNPQTDSFK